MCNNHVHEDCRVMSPEQLSVPFLVQQKGLVFLMPRNIYSMEEVSISGNAYLKIAIFTNNVRVMSLEVTENENDVGKCTTFREGKKHKTMKSDVDNIRPRTCDDEQNGAYSNAMDDCSIAHDQPRIVAEVESICPPKQRPFVTRLIIGCCYLAMDFVLICLGNWLWYIIMFAVVGWDMNYFQLNGFAIQGYIGCGSIYTFYCFVDPRFMDWFKRKQLTYAQVNALNYVLIIVFWIPLYFFEVYAVKFIYNLGNSSLDWSRASFLMTYREQLVFIIFGLQGSWFGLKMFKVEGFGATFLIYLITWCIWAIFADKVMATADILADPTYSADTTYVWYFIYGSAIQSLNMTNLMFFSLGLPCQLEYLPQTLATSERVALSAFATVPYSVFQYMVFWWYHRKAYPTISLSSACNGAWNLVSLSWLPHQNLGARITPVLWPVMSKKRGKNGAPETNLLGIALYFCLMFMLMVAIEAAYYAFYNYVTWPLIWIKLMKYPIDFPPYSRPAWSFAFPMGTIIMSLYGNRMFVFAKSKPKPKSRAPSKTPSKATPKTGATKSPSPILAKPIASSSQ